MSNMATASKTAALLGATMALGLRLGRDDDANADAKEALYSKVDTILAAFAAEILCGK